MIALCYCYYFIVTTGSLCVYSDSLYSAGDSIQLSYLNQLAGYIRLLGKQRLPHVMASVSHLRRLLLALVYVAELDCSHVSILEDAQATGTDEFNRNKTSVNTTALSYFFSDIEDSTYNSLHTWKRFKFIRETSTEEKLTLVCKLLGELGDLALLVDSIFELMSEMPTYRRELTLLLNWISTGKLCITYRSTVSVLSFN